MNFEGVIQRWTDRGDGATSASGCLSRDNGTWASATRAAISMMERVSASDQLSKYRLVCYHFLNSIGYARHAEGR